MFLLAAGWILLVAAQVAFGESLISFDLPALGKGNTANRRCFSLYIGRDVMTTGLYTSTPSAGSRLDFEVTDTEGNVFNTRQDAKETERFTFTSHAHNDYVFCFTNVLNSGAYPNPAYTKTISFSLKIGSEATITSSDGSLLSKSNLKPIEVELNVLEQVVSGIVEEMEYLKQREVKRRDTNESTNARVKWFSILSIALLVGSGAWQVLYLKQFFESKKLI